jgi:hypothetical protein
MVVKRAIAAAVFALVLVAPGARAVSPPPLTEPVFPTGNGTIVGSVRLTGHAPSFDAPRVSDSKCPAASDETVVVNPNHTLRNVLVRLVNAPPTPPPAEPLLLVEEGCMIRPRMAGAITGQRILLRNLDATPHNTVALRSYTAVWRAFQLPRSADSEHYFNDNSMLYRLRCDNHSWTRGFLWVQNNRHFAVTDDSGSFVLPNVPSGTWEIEAFHERLGAKRGTVVVLPDRPIEVHFDYTGTERSLLAP